MKRPCNAKIVATLGPASADRTTIEALVRAGADVFRLNFSHGTHADHKQRLDLIRAIESDIGRPIGVLLDLQGPKLRVGTFANGPVKLVEGAPFRLDLDQAKPGDATRASMPHPEIFAALDEGAELLLDDGRLRLKVEKAGKDFAETRVVNGGMLSDRKGVNVPGVVLPLSAMTEKDRTDLDFGLTLGVDWIALSFVQRAADIVEAKSIIKGRAGIVAKLEKPAAIECLEEILAETDAVMVARGDLGVEMPAEQVPAIQKRIVRACRQRGLAGDRRDADAGVDGQCAGADPCRGLGRGNRDLRRRGRGDALGRIGIGQVPRRVGGDDGPHHRPDRSRPALPCCRRRVTYAAGSQHRRCHRLGGAFGRRAARRGRHGGLHQFGLFGLAHGA